MIHICPCDALQAVLSLVVLVISILVFRGVKNTHKQALKRERELKEMLERVEANRKRCCDQDCQDSKGGEGRT